MRMLKIQLRHSAPLIVPAIVFACTTAPIRRTTPPQPTRQPARLDLELVNQLGDSWSLTYLQVYVDGWLLWQGRPQPRTTSLGIHTLAGAGDQEVYVRAVATRRGGPGGRLASRRRLVSTRAGTQKLQILLVPNQLTSRAFHVALATR